jgi:hypothetical protein
MSNNNHKYFILAEAHPLDIDPLYYDVKPELRLWLSEKLINYSIDCIIHRYAGDMVN